MASATWAASERKIAKHNLMHWKNDSINYDYEFT